MADMMVIEQVAMDLFEMFDKQKAKKLIEDFKQQSSINEFGSEMDMDDKDK